MDKSEILDTQRLSVSAHTFVFSLILPAAQRLRSQRPKRGGFLKLLQICSALLVYVH